jgi:hypothetical protein
MCGAAKSNPSLGLSVKPCTAACCWHLGCACACIIGRLAGHICHAMPCMHDYVLVHMETCVWTHKRCGYIEPRDRERPTVDRKSTSVVPDPRIYDSVHICRLCGPFYLRIILAAAGTGR